MQMGKFQKNLHLGESLPLTAIGASERAVER
jgi:hypothetical protein